CISLSLLAASTAIPPRSLHPAAHPRHRPSFPTRRSSDLRRHQVGGELDPPGGQAEGRGERPDQARLAEAGQTSLVRAFAAALGLDRKSTRLNSSHSQISYAVFCLKKKNTRITRMLTLCGA